MGLDTVELVMSVEEQFDIEITNEEAELIYTVRDMIDLVFAKVGNRDIPVCRTQQTFYRLRRGVRDALGVERSRIRPDTAWDTIIPLAQRKDVWQRLRVAAGNPPRWPQLRRAPHVALAIGGLTAATAFAIYMAVPGNAALAATLVAVAAFFALRQASEQWRIHFAPQDATVGQVVNTLVPSPEIDQVAAGNRWNRDQVRTAVRKIVTEHLNVSPDFRDDASFVDDLGAD